MQYYFVSQKEGKFQLTKEDYHHVKNVMRLKENDHLVCVYEQKNIYVLFIILKILIGLKL